MFGIVGIVVILVMVFGGYAIHGGHLEPILHALPFEMIMIGGAAIGSFLVSNDLAAVKTTLRDIAPLVPVHTDMPAEQQAKLKAALLALNPANPEHAEILRLNRATRYIETKPENYKGLEAAARSAGLL